MLAAWTSIFLSVFLSFFCLAMQNPNGLITLREYIEEGGFARNVLQESDTQQFAVSLENGVVINEGGIITENRKIFKDTETYKEDQHRLLRNKRDISSEDFIFFKGTLAVISSPGQENWYHWLFQVLPRIKILIDSEVEYDKIYINNLKYKWQQESLNIVLKLFNLSEEHLFLVSGDCIVKASTLIVPSVPFIPSKTPAFPLWLKNFIRSTFLTKQDKSNNSKRIYISRSKASIRRISNEKDLAEMLEKRGFTILNLEDLPIREQAELFYNAEIVIGPHGSGFSNLIFSNPGTCVVEIDHGLIGEEQRSFYKRMAEIMGCNYLGYYADFVDEDDLETDITINISDFLRELDTITETQTPL